jgi:mercuric ion transport protein
LKLMGASSDRKSSPDAAARGGATRRNPVLVVVGLLGSVFAAMCCIGLAPLVALVASVGLGFMLTLTILVPLFAFFILVGALGLWRSSRRHGNSLPLILHLAGGVLVTVLLYTTFHGVLLWAGMAAIFAAAGWNIRLEYVYWHREPDVDFSRSA